MKKTILVLEGEIGKVSLIFGFNHKKFDFPKKAKHKQTYEHLLKVIKEVFTISIELDRYVDNIPEHISIESDEYKLFYYTLELFKVTSQMFIKKLAEDVPPLKIIKPLIKN